jgi:hypothetical protein
MTDKTVSSMRVRTRNEQRNSFNERAATREDVLAAVSDLGGKRVDWCEVHSVSAKRPDLCWGASDSYARGHVPARCRMRPQLRVPLDTGDTE